MNNHLLNEKGLTLIELLATLVLVSIISIFSFSLISSAIDSYRINQLNSELRAHADLLFLTINKELTPAHFAKIEETGSLNKDSNVEKILEVKKLTISTTPFLDCRKYDKDSTACTSSIQTLELKELNGQWELFIGGSSALPSDKFKIDGKPTFVIDTIKQTIQLTIKFTYTYSRGNILQEKNETFTQIFRPIREVN